MAEMELKGYKLNKETIGLSQTEYLREYHATVLVKDVVVEVGFSILYVEIIILTQTSFKLGTEC